MSEMIRKAYKTDLNDEQWSRIQPLPPPPKKTGKKISVDLREIVNAILYWNRTGVQWDFLPHDFPPKDTVYYHFKIWKEDGTFVQGLRTDQPFERSDRLAGEYFLDASSARSEIDSRIQISCVISNVLEFKRFCFQIVSDFQDDDFRFLFAVLFLDHGETGFPLFVVQSDDVNFFHGETSVC